MLHTVQGQLCESLPSIMTPTIRMLLGGDLEQRWERCLVAVDSWAYPLGNLEVSGALPEEADDPRTCWLMSRMAMSLRSWVNSWNAASMILVCVSGRVSGKLAIKRGNLSRLDTEATGWRRIRTRLDNDKVLLLVLVDVPDSCEKEASDRVLLCE